MDASLARTNPGLEPDSTAECRGGLVDLRDVLVTGHELAECPAGPGTETGANRKNV
jgi:hypothetical protein